MPFFINELASFLKIHEKIVKIDKIQKPLKSIAEIVPCLPLCIWIVCATPGLVCGGGDKGIGTPCICISSKIPRNFLSTSDERFRNMLPFSVVG